MPLSRDKFREQALIRDQGLCVWCKKPATAVHHLLDRSLFTDGGYYIANGVSLCEACHIQAEQSLLSVEELRQAAGISIVVVPEGFDSSLSYDKWGKIVVSGTLIKYPRTPHLEGSRLQKGDEDLSQVSFASIANKFLVIEEKIDGGNTGISFVDGELHLQSRGHYLRGGPREAQFNLLKTWANTFASIFYEVLGNRYTMYGEWMYAKHTIFYDQLPHYFFEFDIYDTEKGLFLSTRRRQEMLDFIRLYVPIQSVPVLKSGKFSSLDEIKGLIQPSLYKSKNWKESLCQAAVEAGVSPELAIHQTDGSSLAEGVYIKEETEEETVGRYKFVRADFLSAILDSATHWADRPIVPNRLADGVDLFVMSM